MNRLPTTTLQTLVLLGAWCLWPALSVLGAGTADEAFKEGKRALDREDHDSAIARFDEAVRLEPTQPKYRAMRGAAWLGRGQYDKGSADLKAAIRLNPNDAGIGYRPSRARKLSDDALQHGRRQVAAMLRDRPPMAQFAADSDFLRQWAARKFAGEDFGSLVDWDPSPPLHSDAEHLAPGDGDNAAILVAAAYERGPKSGQPRSFEELWAGAIYELHNVTYAKEFVRLNDEAGRGAISKTAFVAEIVKYELRAAQQTRAFYVDVFLPWAAKKKLPTDPTLWFCDWWIAPERVLHGFSDKAAYPWRPYARTHDWATVHNQWRRGRIKRALTVLRQMRAEKGYEDDEAEVHYWIGRCLQQVHKPEEALAAFTEAIRRDPQYADAYEARGHLYRQLGQTDKAKEDLAKAKELER